MARHLASGRTRIGEHSMTLDFDSFEDDSATAWQARYRELNSQWEARYAALAAELACERQRRQSYQFWFGVECALVSAFCLAGAAIYFGKMYLSF